MTSLIFPQTYSRQVLLAVVFFAAALGCACSEIPGQASSQSKVPLRLFDSPEFITKLGEALAPQARQLQTIKLLSRESSKLGDQAPTAESPLFHVTRGEGRGPRKTMRAAVLDFSGASISIKLPERAILEFSSARVEEQNPAGEIYIKVEAASSSHGERIFTTNLAHGNTTKSWVDHSLDLKDLGAREIWLSLRVSSESEDEDLVLVGEPRIVAQRGSAKAEPKQPNVMLISLDTLRADRLGFLGYHRETSPNLDRFARESVVFTNARAPAAKTLPSHAAVFTGLYPETFYYFNESNKRWRIPAGIPTIATYMKRAGYFTIALTAGGYVAAKLGFFKDFDEYREMGNEEIFGRWRKEGEEPIPEKGKITGLRKARKWINSYDLGAPFFMFLHTYAVHAPYIQPPAYRNLFSENAEYESPEYVPSKILNEINNLAVRKGIGADALTLQGLGAAYDRGIRWVDDELEIVLDALRERGIFDNTLIVIFSDHGEEFGEHGYVSHRQLYEEILHVPMIFRFPPKAKFRARRITKNTGIVSILPTLLDFLGIEKEADLEAPSLLRDIEGDRASAGGGVTYASMPYSHVVNDGRFKLYLRSPKSKRPNYGEEIYDLAKDSEEHSVLDVGAGVTREIYDGLLRRLAYYLSRNRPGLKLYFPPGEKEGRSLHIALESENVPTRKTHDRRIESKGLRVVSDESYVDLDENATLITYYLDEEDSVQITLEGIRNESLKQILVPRGNRLRPARFAEFQLVGNYIKWETPLYSKNLLLVADSELPVLWFSDFEWDGPRSTSWDQGLGERELKLLRGLGYL